ncbi:MAG: UvrD-helicase domain-containing protein [Oligoflexia bacterium]|nr:UvrD-helicase domain-containing protein [Oligoflexia bacterium]
MNINFSNELNPPQWEAARTTQGPLLILAGAGSGKTRALTYRIAYLVATKQAESNEILAVTFTNKAAKEMLERSQNLLNRVGTHLNEPLWISTFHSSCARILRKHIEILGYQKDFTIYDDGEQLSVVRRVCEELGINDKIYHPKMFQHHINQAKNLYLNPDQLQKKSSSSFMDDKITNVYKRYEAKMRASNALDFGDLLFKTTQAFEQNADLLEYYQNRFAYIMVDEYQDTNHVQYKLIKLLSQKYKNICVVGDEDQSIYSWRGADITNILNFEQDFPDAKIVKLEENYRSTKNIVEAASHVIKNNHERKNKTLWTSNSAGSPIQIREELNEFEEARNVVKEISALTQDENKSLNEFTVFYRTNAQSRVIEESLRSAALPYKIIGGTKFYDRAEIKDMIAYLRLCANPKDNVALKRIINVPTRGIGKTSVEKIENFATQKDISLFEALLLAIQEKVLDKGAAQKVLNFYELLADLIEKSKTQKLRELFHSVLDQTQYVHKLKLEDTPEAMARVENIEELDSAIEQFEKERALEATLSSFLEEIALVTEADRDLENNSQSVTLMTLHVSKGLEYPVVFIVGLEEGLFPSNREDSSLLADNAEEERRLFYVGMTRAREKLFLSHARTRKVWGNEQSNPASRFLNEIPEKYVQKVSRANLASRWRQNIWQNKSNLVESIPTYEDFEDNTDDSTSFKKGMRVRHPSFGVGIIHGLEGNGEDQKVTILFPNNSIKKFVAKYARLERA